MLIRYVPCAMLYAICLEPGTRDQELIRLGGTPETFLSCLTPEILNISSPSVLFRILSPCSSADRNKS